MTPDDIAFLRPDQPVKVQITAYDASRYGSLDGTITRIGADTVLAPDGESSVFVIEIDLSGRLTDIDGQELEIIPGMVAQVDILSEPKTVLAYFIEPVLRVKDRAFRDYAPSTPVCGYTLPFSIDAHRRVTVGLQMRCRSRCACPI